MPLPAPCCELAFALPAAVSSVAVARMLFIEVAWLKEDSVESERLDEVKLRLAATISGYHHPLHEHYISKNMDTT